MNTIMTALAQRITETPMAPYIGLMRGMTRQDIDIVVTFLNEVKKGAEESMPKNLKISPEIHRLRGCLKLTDEEMQDEYTKYILGL